MDLAKKRTSQGPTRASDYLLVLVIDCSLYIWGDIGANSMVDGETNQTSFAACLDAVMVFLNAYLMLSQNHSIAIVASHAGGSALVYPEEVPGSVDANNERDATISYIDGKQCHFAEVNEMIVRKLKQMAHQAPDFGDMPAPGYTMLSAAIARSLCFINKVKSHWKIGRDLAARVIVVNASPDYAAQYMSVMNCIFAAVKQKVVIDACSLNTHKGTTSGFLQQATEITGGLHMSIKMSEPLLQYLITFYLPNKEERTIMRLPKENDVDYRAACFCHNKVISVGYVCSVCLSVFCEQKGVCSTCRTRFKPRIQRASRK